MFEDLAKRGLRTSVLLALIGASAVTAAKVAGSTDSDSDAVLWFDYMTASYGGDCPSKAAPSIGKAILAARGIFFIRERSNQSDNPSVITRAWFRLKLSALGVSKVNTAVLYLHQNNRLNAKSAYAVMHIARATTDVSGTCPAISWAVSNVADAVQFGNNGPATSNLGSVWHKAAITKWAQDWVDGASPNYGLWIYLDHEDTGAAFDEITLEINGENVSSQASANPSAVGDPHLTNLRGEKFDIHDGMHRLVYYPRGASEDEALLLVDAEAVDMGSEADCYSVYFHRMKFFGAWVGREIVISSDANSSAGYSPSAFSMSFADEHMDWPSVAREHEVHLRLNGSMPVTATAYTREDSTEDAMGGEEISFKIGEVLLQVWSSHGSNQLTHGKDVRFLNLEVQNLPRDSGGILGLDDYTRPSTSHCDLVQDERDLLADLVSYSDKKTALLQRRRPKWRALATVQQ